VPCCNPSTSSQGSQQSCVGKLLLDIRRRRDGSSLATAFAGIRLFDKLFCNLVAAGEQAGILEALLDRLATYKEKTQAIKAKIKSALFYPVSILVVAFLVTAVIMIFVVPAFRKVFRSFGGDLPAPTQVVIGISDYFVANWYIIFGAVGGAIYTFFYTWKRSKAMQIFMDRLALQAADLRDVILKGTVAKWTRTCSTMFAAGVPLVEALDSVGGASGNYVYESATKQIQAEVSSGTSLTVAMQNANVFPNMTTRWSRSRGIRPARRHAVQGGGLLRGRSR